MIWAAALLLWGVVSVAVYSTDHSPRSTQREKAQEAPLWPVFGIIGMILLSVAGAGRIYGAIRAIRVS